MLSDSNELVALCGQLGYQTGESELVHRLTHIMVEKSEKSFMINIIIIFFRIFIMDPQQFEI